MAELAHHSLKAKFKGKQWGEDRHPVAIGLPIWLYVRTRETRREQYLPETFQGKSQSPSRRRKKNPTSEVDIQDVEEHESSTKSNRKKTTKRRSQKENVPPRTSPRRRASKKHEDRKEEAEMDVDEEKDESFGSCNYFSRYPIPAYLSF